MRPLQTLTHSRMSAFKTCLRKHYYLYELGIRRERDATPLRIGQALHLALDARANGASVEAAILQGTAGYIFIPQWAEPDEWAVEQQIAIRLIHAYYWRYEQEAVKKIASEIGFRLPIYNPETGKQSTTFELAGVIDKIVKLPDGRLAVMEHKTTSDDLSDSSDYWSRLRIDQQISLYYIAARQLGYEVETVIYDVVRKPGIRPKLIKGERESPEQFGDRLTEDIATRPDFYFARKEIPRLESDLEEFYHELWHQQKLLRQCQLHDRWFRNSNACLHPYKCEFFDLCLNGFSSESELPPNYMKLKNIHPELEGKVLHDRSSSETSSSTQTDAAPYSSNHR